MPVRNAWCNAVNINMGQSNHNMKELTFQSEVKKTNIETHGYFENIYEYVSVQFLIDNLIGTLNFIRLIGFRCSDLQIIAFIPRPTGSGSKMSPAWLAFSKILMTKVGSASFSIKNEDCPTLGLDGHGRSKNGTEGITPTDYFS